MQKDPLLTPANALEVKVGPESALSASLDEVRLLFAIGPAKKVEYRQPRMQRVLRQLAPSVHALLWAEQVHGRTIASVASEPGESLQGVASVGRCDGLICGEVGIAIAVWTADCVPVLLWGNSVVAAVHAGWRGIAADIVGAAVGRFRTEYGVEAAEIQAALGPAISGACYPVGNEVITALKRLHVPDGSWREGCHVDLRALLTARLGQLGIRPTAIQNIGGCTVSSPRLASFRRDGPAAGRQWSMIYRPSRA
ncbi:MAG: polyphenol oxidase family protein [Holophagae bacterium]|jgi:YfiH family protein